MEEQLPELVNSLESIRHLRRNSQKNEIKTNFKLTDGVYANATILNTRKFPFIYISNILRQYFL